MVNWKIHHNTRKNKLGEYSVHTFQKGLSSLNQEVKVDHLPIQGQIPNWLSGTLFRNGPAHFTGGHWFDGLAMIHKFSFQSGNVSYSNRFLRTDAYHRVIEAEQQTGGFGSAETTVGKNNTNVNIIKMDHHFLALTESPGIVEFDPITLHTVGVYQFDDDIPAHMTTAHPHIDSHTGQFINFTIQFGRTTSYHIYSLDPVTARRRLIGSIETDRPGYMHSFAITERFIILLEFPLIIQSLELMKGKGFTDSLIWKPEQGLRFLIVSKMDGKVQRIVESQAGFGFHIINAFEQGEDIIIDACISNDASAVTKLVIDQLTGDSSTRTHPQCDQVEDPRAAKGLVRRDITRIVTPGTVVDPQGLHPDAPCYLAALQPAEAAWGIALLDLSTGRFHAGLLAPGRLPEAFSLFRPREVLLPEGSELPFETGLSVTHRSGAWFEEARSEARLDGSAANAMDPVARAAAAAARAYAGEMRPRGLPHVLAPELLRFDERMGLDASAVATLELFESSDSDSRRSLCSLLDRTRTPMGARALKETISRPSLDPVDLEERWDAVEELIEKPEARESVRGELDGVGDLERRFGRISVGTAGPRDVAAFGAGLKRIPGLARAGVPFSSARIRRSIDGLPDVADLVDRIEGALAPDPPVLASAGGVIRAGADAELDSLRELRRDAQGALLAIEAEERRRSGISTLKIRFNRVFGYSLEVGARAPRPRAGGLDPPTVARQRRALRHAGAEGARREDPRRRGPHRRDRGAPLRRAARGACDGADRVARTAAAVARARPPRLASRSRPRRRWVRPRLSATPRICDRRRAAIRSSSASGARSPSSRTTPTSSAGEAHPGRHRARTWGASRPTCGRSRTIVLLAQAGSFVPAARAGALDRATGSSPASARPTTSRAGESTFMVEMLESAAILREATPAQPRHPRRGRARHLHVRRPVDRVGAASSTSTTRRSKAAFVLFATHYHELTEIALVKPAVVNATMAVKEIGGRVVFLRKVVPGARRPQLRHPRRGARGTPRRGDGAGARGALQPREAGARRAGGARSSRASAGRAPESGQFLLFSAEEELALEKLRAARHRPDDSDRRALAARDASGPAEERA